MDISIIVPVYNASKYLRECLDSLVNQDFKGDYEIILVNDGSTDDSLSICQEYASKHSNITVLTGENGGVSVARNKGIDASRGDWFFFADADDLMTPDALTTLYQRQQETNADMLFANVVYLIDGVAQKPSFNLPNETLSKPVCNIHHEPLWGYLIPANVVIGNNIRFMEGLAMGEDTLFCYQTALRCKTIAFSNKVVYLHRIHPESTIHNTNNSVRIIKHNYLAAYHFIKLADANKQKDREVFRSLKSMGGIKITIALQEQGLKYRFYEKRADFYQTFGKGVSQTVVFYRSVALICFRKLKRRIRSIFQRSSQ